MNTIELIRKHNEAINILEMIKSEEYTVSEFEKQAKKAKATGDRNFFLLRSEHEFEKMLAAKRINIANMYERYNSVIKSL